MRTLNYVKILFLLTIAVTFAACGDKYYDDEYLKNSDEKLCRTSWVDDYINEDDELCVHTLEFYTSGKGLDILRKYRKIPSNNWENTHYQESTISFDWKWMDNTMEGLILDYTKSISYFDNVWVRERYLSGKLNGEHVTYIDKRYY